jgi:hypothetical protein
MGRAAFAIAAVAAIAVLVALATSGLHALPESVRLTLAFATLVLLPGAALVRLSALPPGGAWLAPAWAVGCGVAWNAALILASRAAGMPFTALTPWATVASAALCAAALVWGGRERDAMPALPRWAVAGVLAAVVLAAWYAARLGPPLTYYSDSPDHIGTIRRMLAHGDAFPRDAFFRDAGAAGVDPRKGLWHPLLAMIVRLAGVDPLLAWRELGGVLAASYVLVAAAFGMLIGGPVAAVLAAWALLLTYGGSLARAPLREAVFATKFADQLALAATVAVLADLAAPSRRRRVVAVLLALGAIATHVFAAIQLAIVLGALGLGLLVRDRRWSAELRRLSGNGIAMAVASLPYLLWRLHGATGPHNVIHSEPQGLLWLWDHQRIVSIGVLWDWMGYLWLLFPLSWFALWKHARARTAPLFLLTTSLAIVLILFNPIAVALLEPRVGYLLMRMVWIFPLAGLLAWMLPALVGAVRRRTGLPRVRAALALLLVALMLAPGLADGAWALRHMGTLAAEDEVRSPLRWREGLAWMQAELPPGRVVLADPATSYSIPMLTNHYVLTLVDQHSSPNDTLALTRILDARDALDPFATWARTREVIRNYGVDVVVLNDRFAEIPRLDYWAPQHPWYVAARARLDAAPAAFERVYDRAGFVVYRVHSAALDTLATPATPRPFVTPFDPARTPIARRMGEGLPALVTLSLGGLRAMPGDTMHAVATWRVPAPLAPGAYQVVVRFDRELPGGLAPPAMLAKPVRKLVEQVRGERYRFRLDHLPVAGAYGVDRWRPDELVRDSFALALPRDIAGGTYVVRIKMIRQPHFPNYRLSDYFLDDDYYTGLVSGTLFVGPGQPSPGAGLPEGH